MIADGGGIVRALAPPVVGLEVAARFAADMVGGARGLEITERTVNGQPGLGVLENGVTVTVMAFEVAEGRITNI
ncbi:hypothetical protein [Herbidospora sp. RD11066]